jgi:hypothetical protein
MIDRLFAISLAVVVIIATIAGMVASAIAVYCGDTWWLFGVPASAILGFVAVTVITEMD